MVFRVQSRGSSARGLRQLRLRLGHFSFCVERSNLQRDKIESRETSWAVIAVVQESMVRAWMGVVGVRR